MGSDWAQVAFADVVELISGGTPKTNVHEYWGGSIPWLSVKDFNTGYRWASRAEKTITERGLEESATTILNRGDIIISARGTVGVVAQLALPMAFNQSCYGIRGKQGIATNFVYYALRHAVLQMQQVAHGGVFNTITRDTFKIIKTKLPPLKEQRAIAHILGSLDDKIELNRQMNRTLEKMAQAIFKSWFIDFDPVHAKAEGRDTGLPKELADLFPDSFEDSELGEIPKGWKVKPIGDVIELAYGKSLPKNKRKHGSFPVYGSGGVTGFHNKHIVKGPGIIVGRKGTVGSVYWEDRDFFPIDTVFYVNTKIVLPLYWVFLRLSLMNIQKLGADSAVPGVNRNSIYAQKWVVPSSIIAESFRMFSNDVLQQVEENRRQIETLSVTRDTLLPKLISGELPIPDAEKILEGVE